MLPGSCVPGEFDCGNGTCISVRSVRDYKVDCPTGTDEARPMNVFHCGYDCGRCGDMSDIPIDQRFSCPLPNLFICLNGDCISADLILNGENDCGDWSDELGGRTRPPTTTDIQRTTPVVVDTTTTQTTTPVAQTTTTTTTPPLTIVYPNPIDPMPATVDLYQRYFNNTCGRNGMYQCTDGSCIPNFAVRDCRYHCRDGSDEVCASASSVRCGNCKCASAFQDVCIDEEIASLCNTMGLHPCQDNSACVRLSWLLNNVTDCPDASDEDPAYLHECLLGIDKCSGNAICVNIVDGGYECYCKFGYMGDGFKCVDPYYEDRQKLKTNPVEIVEIIVED